jgi:S1-C subfamily serine protease
MKTLLRTLARWFLWMIAVALFGALGSLWTDRYAIPKFADSLSTSRFAFLKKATENTTIINKVEQVVIREDDSVEKLASQAATAAVRIISRAQSDVLSEKALERNYGARVHTGSSLVGSGVLVTNDGLIATYRKAILEKDAAYMVTLFNGAVSEARLIGIDPLTNVAYLKIDVGNVPAIAFANSDDARSGKKLIAIALASEAYRNQFATALLNDVDKTRNLSEKTVASSEKWEGVFTMDFPNQHQYVGAPVINYGGEMVGIEAFTEFDNTRQYFVLPANVIKASLELALRDGGLRSRPVLGAYYLSVTKEMSLAYGIPVDHGALVFSPSGKSGLAVIAGSPADKAKLLVNDIIVSIAGQAIDLGHPLSVAVSRFKKGDIFDMTVLRDGQERQIRVEL